MGFIVGRGKWNHMIMAVIDIDLKYPYDLSMGTLVEFCSLWDSLIYSGSTQKRKAEIAMPSNHFKSIFGSNPVVKEYQVPKGTEKFIESLKVKEVIVK